ncbi:uncharacterized protein KY384_005235 [Bacidia gigantensis]|uniref:uncharacterized protein n=1 Tax=Bacidia gigantensis TaxID=2732470 RepID=UPI001D04AE4C|nr:uncharacterized protein KY384_005235 [Bacidia gigantensis]KAG8529754.1 hypothetical protein KY384_005235 [Bacidia gigantensis]
MLPSLISAVLSLLLVNHHVALIAAQDTNHTNTIKSPNASGRSVDCSSGHGMSTDRIPTKDCINAILQMDQAPDMSISQPLSFADGKCAVSIAGGASTSWIAIHIAVGQIAQSCTTGNGDTIANGGSIITGPRADLKVTIQKADSAVVADSTATS